jgi:hypothetical protein
MERPERFELEAICGREGGEAEQEPAAEILSESEGSLTGENFSRNGAP